MVDIQSIRNQRPGFNTVMKMHGTRALKAPLMGKRITSHASLFLETEEAAPEKVARKTRCYTSTLTLHLVEYNASQISVIVGI